jgi:hypothetical protein
MKNLSNKMTSENVEQRPNCEEILEEKHLWALNAAEFDNFFKLIEIAYLPK